MEKYFLICKKRLVKGVSLADEFDLADEAFEYNGESWVEIPCNEINDRLMGYDPTEDDFFALGNTEIMSQIRAVSDEEREEFIRSLSNRKED